MIAIFSANIKPKGFWDTLKKIINPEWWLSYLIKVFTWPLISKEVREYFELDFWRCPTHTYNYVTKTEEGEWVIFEASILAKYSLEYGPRWRCAVLKNGEPFHDRSFSKYTAHKHNEELYGFSILINHVRIWFWWIIGVDKRGANAWFVARNVCSEFSYTLFLHEALNGDAPYVAQELSRMNSNLVSPATLMEICYWGAKKNEVVIDYM